MEFAARLLVDLEAVAANWRLLARASGAAACGAAIKADGYGLGARPVMEALWRAGARDFFVASWAEAEALGALPEGARLAVFHGVTPAEMAVAARLGPGVRPVLNTAAQAALWREASRPADVMVETGMNRLGLSDLSVLAGMEVDTLHSHLACADTPAHPLNAGQLAAFCSAADAAAALGVTVGRRALANSPGIGLGADYHFDLTRPGIGIYGAGPSAVRESLAPVVAIEAPVLQVRDVPVGGSVGYGATFVAARPSRVAVTALGYADGYPRAMAGHGFAGHGFATVGGVRCPLIGRVSMDLTAFDVTDAGDVAEGDWLAVDFDVGRAAAALGRAEYELLTGLGRRYARVYK